MRPPVAGLILSSLAAFITASAAVAPRHCPHAVMPLITLGLVVPAAGALGPGNVDSDPSYLTDVLPASPCSAWASARCSWRSSVAAMGDVGRNSRAASGAADRARIGAALGVAAVTAVASDPHSRAGIVDGTHDAFIAVAIGLAALLILDRCSGAHDPRPPHCEPPRATDTAYGPRARALSSSRPVPAVSSGTQPGHAVGSAPGSMPSRAGDRSDDRHQHPDCTATGPLRRSARS